MAHAFQISLTAAGGTDRHVYRAEVLGAHGPYTAHLTLRELRKVIFPSDEAGKSTGTTRLEVAEDNFVGESTPAPWEAEDFSQVSAHLAAVWLKQGAPPETVTRHFS